MWGSSLPHNAIYLLFPGSFAKNPKILLQYCKPNVGEIDVAIHIRRGDVDSEETGRYTKNDDYVKIIDRLKITYPLYTIKIFSEGKFEDFQDLGLAEECFLLNIDVAATFHSLVSAKVLISAKSSFSYAAALLNENTVYHPTTFWHHKLDHWLPIHSLL